MLILTCTPFHVSKAQREEHPPELKAPVGTVLRVLESFPSKLGRTHPAPIPPVRAQLVLGVCGQQVAACKGSSLDSKQRALEIPGEVHFRFIFIVPVMAFQLVDRNAVAVLDEGCEGSIRVVLSGIDENLLFFQRSNDGPLFTCLGEQAGHRCQNKSKGTDFKCRLHYGTCTVPAGQPTALGAVTTHSVHTNLSLPTL